MKQRLDRVLSLRSGVARAAIGLALMSAVPAGCASATIDNAVPTASSNTLMPAPAEATARAATVAPAVADASAVVETAPANAPSDTGTFPNLNIKPQVATDQISPEEKQAQIEAMTAAQKQQAAVTAAGSKTTDPVLLRKLAATHAKDALKAIEAQK
jgi:hypothetical protein